jgi:hypothetical protein
MKSGSQALAVVTAPPAREGRPNPRDAFAVAELFDEVFRRDLVGFYPNVVLDPEEHVPTPFDLRNGPNFRLVEPNGGGLAIELFGVRSRLVARDGKTFTPHDLRMIVAIGAVLSLRYHHLFQLSHGSRLELYRGGSEDHYIAAFVEPGAYTVGSARASRVASAIQTLRTAALSTYENRRVSTGALLLGQDPPDGRPSPDDALPYEVGLTALKSIHRLCDGKRTLFLVDLAGNLVEVVDIARKSEEFDDGRAAEVPCARDYEAHARATRSGGNLCVVLSPNQEIKVFAAGSQAFAFAHGRWRILDAAAKFATWNTAVADPKLARVLFQAALDLAECRQGGLFVVVDDPNTAIGHLIAPYDLLTDDVIEEPSLPLGVGDPLAKRALHYLARGRNVVELDASVLESIAALDGAIATDRFGKLLAFGAILRHDASAVIGPAVEGARTTAALVASRHGPVLKVSEDGIVSCFLGGARVWDL